MGVNWVRVGEKNEKKRQGIQGIWSVLLLSWGVRQGYQQLLICGCRCFLSQEAGRMDRSDHTTSFPLPCYHTESCHWLAFGTEDLTADPQLWRSKVRFISGTHLVSLSHWPHWGAGKATRYHVGMNTAKELLFKEKNHQRCKDFPWFHTHPESPLSTGSEGNKRAPEESGPHSSCTAQQDLSHETSPPDFPGSLLPHHLHCGR